MSAPSLPRVRCRATFAVLVVAAAAAPPAGAQDPAPRRTLAQLQQAFARAAASLYQGDAYPTPEQERELRQRQERELAAFLQHEAEGNDRWAGRLLLADLRNSLRDRDGARAALREIDPEQASPIACLLAAAQLQELGDQQRRDQLVHAALAKEAPFETRMEMAKLLMTLLREVAAGEAIFAAAARSAADDEARARVAYARAEAIREREDLPEDSYFEALDALAARYPHTYYGGIARDRCIASQFRIGAEAIPFRAQTLDGKTFELAAQRDKAVLLVFWSAADAGAPQLVRTLSSLQREHGSELQLLGIAVDPDPAAVAQTSKQLGAQFPVVCDGRGLHGELALRYLVETAPTLIAIDRQGRIAGLNLHIGTADAREELREAVARALAR